MAPRALVSKTLILISKLKLINPKDLAKERRERTQVVILI